jgi:hypothetical protein
LPAGGLVATQLGFGNTNLDKIEIILKGHELAESVIVKNDLMPILFPQQWDKTKRAWKSKNISEIPTLRDGVIRMREEIL